MPAGHRFVIIGVHLGNAANPRRRSSDERELAANTMEHCDSTSGMVFRDAGVRPIECSVQRAARHPIGAEACHVRGL